MNTTGQKVPHTKEQLDALTRSQGPTQFGGERANPRFTQIEGANRPYSIRNATRYLLAQEAEPGEEDLKRHLPKKPKYAQIIAANTITKAINGDMKAVEFCTENAEGKLPQTNLNSDMARLSSMSEEELLAERERLRRIVEGDAIAGGAGEEAGSPGGDTEPAAGLPGSSTPTGI